MAFEDAKKYLPTPEKPVAQPKEKPQPLELGRSMTFNGVVGRPSLYIPTKLTNPNSKAISVHLRSTNPDFHVRSSSEDIESTHDGDNTADAFVSYDPRHAGTSRGVLEIETGFTGEAGPQTHQVLELEGTATALEHLTTAPADGSPRAIPDLDKQPKGMSPRDQATRDLDAASGLADTYRAVVGAGDAATTDMFRKIGDLTTEFGHRVEEWVHGELPKEEEAERSPAWKALGKLVGLGVDKGLELLEVGTIATAVVGFVADQAFDAIVDHGLEDHGAKAKKAHGAAAMENGAEAVAAVSSRVTNRITPLAVRLATTRAVARRLATADAMQREGVAQAKLHTGSSYEHVTTAVLMNDFRDALDRYNDAVRAIASTFTQLPSSLEKSFDDLRMNYLKMRAHKSSDMTYRIQYFGTWDLGSEASNGRETVRMFDPVISGYSGLSEEMREFVVHRKLSSFADDADISVQLECKQGGGVMIEKKVGKEPTFNELVGNAAIQAAIRSPQAVWKFLEEHVG